MVVEANKEEEVAVSKGNCCNVVELIKEENVEEVEVEVKEEETVASSNGNCNKVEEVNKEREEEEEEEAEVAACAEAWGLVYASILPMLLRTVCELGIPDILHAARPHPLSTLQIVQKLHDHHNHPITDLHKTVHLLDRVMRCLSAHGVFKTTVARTPTSATHVPVVATLTPTTLYLPTRLSSWLLHHLHHRHHGSLHGLLMFLTSPSLLLPWFHLTPYISHGDVEPFSRAHSMELWQYAQSHPHFTSLLNDAMSSDTISLSALLSHYHGFVHIHTLVDVGGGVGTAASHIVSCYPTLKVICFDLPHVITMAPTSPGVDFVAGDMFKKIPKGDAIFMKWILHDWSDEDCIKILENCHKALLRNGKLIIMDAVLENGGQEEQPFGKLKTLIDISMLGETKGGKERTKEEWQILLKQAKFSLHRVIHLPCPQSILEAIPFSYH